MRNLINIENKNGELVVSSREVAYNFEKRHDKLMTEIERMYKDKTDEWCVQNGGDPWFYKTYYTNEQNKQKYPMYSMTRDGFSLLVMGFTGKKALNWKYKYIEAFNNMEKRLLNKQSVKLPKNPMDILKLTFEVQKEHEEKINDLTEKVEILGENAPLSPSEYSYLTKLIRERINFVKTTYSKTEATRLYTRELYRAINKDIDSVAGVCTRSQLRKKHFNTVVELIKIWTPSAALNFKLEQLSIDY